MKTNEKSFPWEDLDTTHLLLPTELLAYYLYKHAIDKRAKRDSQRKRDLFKIEEYALKLNIIEKEVEDVFRINRGK